MKKELTVSQLIAALRERARTCNDRADALERDLKMYGFDDDPSPRAASNGSREVTPDELKQAMRQKKGRMKHFAERLGTSEAIIAAIVQDPANGITNRNKGWLEFVEPVTAQASEGAGTGGR